jgi:predicted transcriptional regulator
MARTKATIERAEVVRELRDKGLSYREIGEHLGVGRITVRKDLVSVGAGAVKEMEEYTKNRLLVWKTTEKRLIDALTEEKLERANAVQLMTGAAICFDKTRLIEGKATTHVMYAHIIMKEKELGASVEELEREIAAREVKGLIGDGTE